MNDMKPSHPGVKVLDGYSPRTLPLTDLIAGAEPVVLKGLVSSWEIVGKGAESDESAMRYLGHHDSGKPVPTAFTPPEARGRLHYRDDFTQLNFQSRQLPITAVLRLLAATFDQGEPEGIYVASASIDRCLPGLRAENDLGLEAQGIESPPSIWIGNRVTATCHYDVPHNLACNVIGRRRFTLFPPEQITNLYPGPLDPTPGGQAISLVDFSAPDLDRFPRFARALEHAQVAELAPGDALYIPSLWWHHVQGLNRFNVLVNYWWKVTARHIANPVGALQYAMWSLRARPQSEKQAWRAIFDYYVFGPAQDTVDHLPAAARGILGEIDEARARQIRAQLINDLNR